MKVLLIFYNITRKEFRISWALFIKCYFYSIARQKENQFLKLHFRLQRNCVAINTSVKIFAVADNLLKDIVKNVTIFTILFNISEVYYHNWF